MRAKEGGSLYHFMMVFGIFRTGGPEDSVCVHRVQFRPVSCAYDADRHDQYGHHLRHDRLHAGG